MRLSSTKNVSVVGKKLSYDPTDHDAAAKVAQHREKLLEGRYSKFVPKKPLGSK
jgi:hypothetical protein